MYSSKTSEEQLEVYSSSFQTINHDAHKIYFIQNESNSRLAFILQEVRIKLGQSTECMLGFTEPNQNLQ